MKTWFFNEESIEVLQEPGKAFPKHGFLWVDGSSHELKQIAKTVKEISNVQIHKQHIDDIKNSLHPSCFESMQEYDFFIFRNLTTHKISKLDTQPVTFIMMENMLITIHDKDKVITDIQKKFSDPKRYTPKKIDGLVYQIINTMLDQYVSLRDPLSNEFSFWQERLLNNHPQSIQWTDFLDFKQSVQKIHLIADQQLDAINQWQLSVADHGSDALYIRLRDLESHINRVSRFTHQYELYIDSLLQLHYLVISNRTNEVMRFLTVISSIFLPLTLITGLFGMNFVHMPLLKNLEGFWITMGIMLAVAIGLLGVFKIKKWI